ncbi:MAG: hypothetical protein UY18_C0008G0052 [Microgenomates group bacterium GW2011_GWF2_47_9]|nr:MAG: hypothetical protein UY18_C0008G0052 [Microgenomates group bacterium GW2011_GWF2_47_9]
MYNFSPTDIVVYSTILLLFVFNLVTLIMLIKLKKHYNSLVENADKQTLISALEGIQKTLALHEKSIMVIKKDLNKAVDSARLHVQRMTLKRFNPFSDTGGDQSFILALLDGNKDGVVITSLHSRENTRFYVKSVKGGSGVDHPLSSEEQKIVK